MTVNEFELKVRALYEELVEGYTKTEEGDPRNVCVVVWYPEQSHTQILLPMVGLSEAVKLMESTKDAVHSKFTYLIDMSHSLLTPVMSKDFSKFTNKPISNS